MIIGPGISIGPGIRITNDIVQTATVVTSGLQMYWDIGKSTSYPGSGTVITDLSGNGINGTISGATYTGGGLVTGLSKYIYTPSTFNLGSAWTMSIVSNTSTSQPQYWATMWGDEAWPSNGYLAYQTSSSTLSFGTPTGGTAYSGTVQGSNTAWDFTFDGSTVKLYKNGATTPVASSAMSPLTASSAGIFFGARHVNGGGSTPTDYSATTFYQMRVYNRALTSTEVAYNYSIVKSTYPSLSLP